MQHELTVFTGDLNKISTSTTGATSCTYLSRKAYGEKFVLKGADLKRKHEDYRLQRGTMANQNVASMLAGGQIVIEKCRLNKTGTAGSFNFTMANQFEAGSQKEQIAAAIKINNDKLKQAMLDSGLTEEQIAAILSSN